MYFFLNVNIGIILERYILEYECVNSILLVYLWFFSEKNRKYGKV